MKPFGNQQRKGCQREEELDAWISKARAERDAKAFRVLDIVVSPEDQKHSDACWLSATETTRRIRSKTLDLLDNIVLLSNRCRHYGPSNNAFNQSEDDFGIHPVMRQAFQKPSQ